VGGEGWGLGRGCAPSQKIYEFFISKWCDMVHTGRIADENDSDLRYSEVPLKGKNKTLVKILGVVNTVSTQDYPCRSNIGGGSRPLQSLRR